MMQSTKKLNSLKPGHHACLFYKDAQTAMVITAEFIKTGLAKNERCVYLADPLVQSATAAILNASGIDVKAETKRGALNLSSRRDYLDNGLFSSERMVDFLDAAIDKSLKDGFEGLRATGDVIWELGNDVDMFKLENYERLLDQFLPGKKITGLCQYNLNVVPEHALCQSLCNHKAVVLNECDFRDNPFHQFTKTRLNKPFSQLLASISV